MKSATLALLLLAATCTLSSAAEATPLRADEPEAKAQLKKAAKPKKKWNLRIGRRRYESAYSRDLRRNELLREPAATSAEPTTPANR